MCYNSLRKEEINTQSMEDKKMMKFFVVLFAVACVLTVPALVLTIALQSLTIGYCFLGIAVLYCIAIVGMIVCDVKGL